MMKQQIIMLFLLHTFISTFSQEKYVYHFEKIEAVDTIFKKEILDDLLKDVELFDQKYFISYYANERIPAFYIREKDFYIAMNLDFSNQTNYNIIGLSENRQFIFINAEGDHSARQTQFGFKYLYIVNLANNTFLQIQDYSSLVYWEPDENDPNGFNVTKEHTVNISKIAFNKNELTVLSNVFDITSDDKINYDVIQSGVYELDASKLKKTKYYDADLMKFQPIKYVGDIAIGMTLADLNLIYPYISFVEKENIYKTCAEETTGGFEIWDGNEVLGYATSNTNDKKIQDLKVLSPRIQFGKLSTNSTAQEVLKFYPKSNVRVDSLTEWEHIFVKELNIELVFKTNESSRIGSYKNETFKKLKNPNAKADFIRVL